MGTKFNLVAQGTAVGEPLGARQVALMNLGDVPICCRIPTRRLCLGKAPVPGELTGARWVQVLERCTAVESGALVVASKQMTVSG